MAQLLNLTGPMMRRGTSFHANETGRQLAEESQHPTALQLPAGNRLSRTINAVHLEDVLRNIKTNYANLIHAWLLPGGSLNTATLAHRDAGGGAVHSITSRRFNDRNPKVGCAGNAIVHIFPSSISMRPSW
jgi:hypothetical protein